MALAISTPTSLLYSSSGKTSLLCSFSTPTISIPRNAVFPQLGFAPLSHWNGLKHMGISISRYPVKIERKGKSKGKGNGIYASLFGVGAPEILVIGVVALLVFGPKGLAEVARNLGQTLRAFQPTIKELQEVSREFKNTLEREIGLDDPEPRISSSNRPMPTPEDSATNIEPNGTSKDSTNDELTAQADRFKQTLAQLQKEQEEERLQKEEEAGKEAELITTSQDTSQASDTPDGTSPVEEHKEGTLQEVVTPSGNQAPKDETEA